MGVAASDGRLVSIGDLAMVEYSTKLFQPEIETSTYSANSSPGRNY